MTAPVEVGDKVMVNLCGTWFSGRVRVLRPNLNWTDETYAEVTGDTPEAFITTCKVSGLIKPEEPSQ